MSVKQKAQQFMKFWNNMDIRCAVLVAHMQMMGYNNVVERIKQLAEEV